MEGKKCKNCLSSKYYAKGLCYVCYEKNTRKRGKCITCGAQTCRQEYKKCVTCSNRENPKHAMPHSYQSKEKMRKNNWRAHNESHPQWKGKSVGYCALHRWVRRHKQIPTRCELCGKKGRLDASNKDHKYSRNLDDWQFLCPACHKTFDLQNGFYSHSGDKHHFFGKRHTEETKRKISNTIKNRGKSNLIQTTLVCYEKKS